MSPAFDDGTRLIFYYDEINLPLGDEYGTVQAVQFLEEVFNCQSFFHPVLLKKVYLNDVRFICSYNPSKTSIMPKLFKNFVSIHIGYPSTKSLEYIVSNFLQFTISPNYVSLTEQVSDLAKYLVVCFAEMSKILDEEKAGALTPRDLTRFCRCFSHYFHKNESNIADAFQKALTTAFYCKIPSNLKMINGNWFADRLENFASLKDLFADTKLSSHQFTPSLLKNVFALDSIHLLMFARPSLGVYEMLCKVASESNFEFIEGVMHKNLEINSFKKKVAEIVTRILSEVVFFNNNENCRKLLLLYIKLHLIVYQYIK